MPNLIIAGVNKSGTTSLFTFLSAHPEICASRKKETLYFLPLRYGATELPPIEEYRQHFRHCSGTRYVMEATPGYFYGGAAVARAISERLGDVRILVMLREPISRLFSYFRFKKSMLDLDPDLPLEEYIRLCESVPPGERNTRENNTYWGIEGGFYANYIDQWFEVFSTDHLRILFFEQFIGDPRSVLEGVCSWLGLESRGFVDTLAYTVENRAVAYRSRTLQRLALTLNWRGEEFWRSHPRIKRLLRRIYYALNEGRDRGGIPPDTRAYLEALYDPYNQRLSAALASRGYVDLPDWLVLD